MKNNIIFLVKESIELFDYSQDTYQGLRLQFMFHDVVVDDLSKIRFSSIDWVLL